MHYVFNYIQYLLNFKNPGHCAGKKIFFIQKMAKIQDNANQGQFEIQ